MGISKLVGGIGEDPKKYCLDERLVRKCQAEIWESKQSAFFERACFDQHCTSIN